MSASVTLAFLLFLLRFYLLLGIEYGLASLEVVVHGLGPFVQLAVATSTEVCHAQMFSGMRECGFRILIHHPTVGAERYLFPDARVTCDIGQREPI